jgi:hypothetical protein
MGLTSTMRILGYYDNRIFVMQLVLRSVSSITAAELTSTIQQLVQFATHYSTMARGLSSAICSEICFFDHSNRVDFNDKDIRILLY